MFYATLCNRSPIFSFLAVGALLLGSFTIQWWNYQREDLYSYSFILVLHHAMIFLVAATANFTMTRQKIVGVGDYNLLVLLTVSLLGISVSLKNSLLMMGSLLAVLLIHRLGKLFNQAEAAIEEFELGVIAGLGLLVAPLFLFLLPFVLLGLNLTKSNRLRDFIAVLLGFSFVFFLKVLWAIWMEWQLLPLAVLPWGFNFQLFHQLDWKEIVFIGLVGFWYLRQVLYYMRKADQLSIRLRIFYRTVVLLIALLLLPPFILELNVKVLDFTLVLMPFFMILHQLQNGKNQKRWANDLLLTGLLVGTFCLHFFDLNA